MSLAGLIFGLFFFGAVAQFLVLSRVETVLRQRHPQVWQALEDNSVFTSRAISHFIFRRDDLTLNDPVLSRTVRRAAFFYCGMIAVWCLFALSLFTGIGRMYLDFSQWPPRIH